MRWLLIPLATIAVISCEAPPEGDAIPDPPEPELPLLDFTDVEPNPEFGELAADFTLPTTTDEPWVFSEHFDGRDIYVFSYLVPGSSYHGALWAEQHKKLLAESPDNTHYFFISYDEEEDTRLADLAELEDEFRTAVDRFDDEATRDRWTTQLHFVTSSGFDLDWISELGASNTRRTEIQNAGYSNVGFVIDRTQRIRTQGETWDWITNEVVLPWLANEPWFVEMEWLRDQELAAEDALIVPIFEEAEVNAGWSGAEASTYVEVEIPDLSAYDTLQFDAHLDCYNSDKDHHRNCPEWDRETNLYLCDTDDTDVCTTEIGRYISAYSRSGRWVHDATPLLGLLGQGGVHRFRFHSVDRYKLSLSLRATDSGAGQGTPTALIPLFSGGSLDETSNDRYEPMEIEIPATATRVEVATLISGHGWGTDTQNCAEFCNHQHYFGVNGEEWLKEHPEADDYYGCSNQVDDFVVPNQYGSWQFGRAGWCPGKEVPFWRADVTDVITPGQTAEFTYRVLVNGQEFVPIYTDEGDYYPVIKMSSWAVIYE